MNKHTRFIKLTEVKQITGLSTSSIYRGMNDRSFPQNIKVGARSTVWDLTEIETWMVEKINNRDHGQQ